MMSILALALAAEAAPTTTPLAPSTKWNVDYADNSCMLSRQFGEGDGTTTLSWRALPFTDTFDVYVMRRSGPDAMRFGAATILFNGVAVDEVGFEYYRNQARMPIMRIPIDKKTFDRIGTDVVLSVQPSWSAPVSVSLNGARSAFAALRKCTDDLAREWKLDPREEERIELKARTIVDGLRTEDYPRGALMQGQQGFMALLITVGSNGRVAGCKVVVPSAVPAFNAVACTNVTRHARFLPALDRNGNPVESHKVRNVTWRMADWESDSAYLRLQAKKEAEAKEKRRADEAARRRVSTGKPSSLRQE